ncbi:hypothetical protein ACHAW5_001095 [Stephanodiscus triporus]|uniref:Uncharacterized protein n=1 Tax=Stephanodiscus triporus TaxID=2934178 RepID=A0ABD3PXI1_9STRA
MLRQLISSLLAISWDVRCHAFQRSQRSALIISPFFEGDLHLRTRKRHRQVFSIRGGDDDNDENKIDDNAAYLEFIASFESELAEIRREAEIEAENEMRKLLGFFERRGGVEDENVVTPEYKQDTIDDGNESDSTIIDASREVLIDETSEHIDPSEIESDEVLPKNGDTIDQPDIESGSEDEKNKTLRDNGIGLDGATFKVSDSAPESDDAVTDAGEVSGTRIVDSTTNMIAKSKVKGRIKQKKMKSKMGKKKVKEMRNFYEDMESSGDWGRVDFGDSMILTRTKTDDVAPSLQSGIWVFLRSDLGRALGLFIATVLLAIITTRLQRQMEEAEAISGIK